MVLKMLGGRPSRVDTGHLQSRAPEATGVHDDCFQMVQDDMSKVHSVNKDWEFVSKGTEISLGKFVSEYFTPLTRGDLTVIDVEEVQRSF
jgi:hypothetical protein